MTVKSIMSDRLVKLKPTDTVYDALKIMHNKQVRNLPVVDDDDQFIGLFGIRRLTTLLLPTAARIGIELGDLDFMSDEPEQISSRLKDICEKPVSEYLEKKKRLMLCKPSTSIPEIINLLDQSPDTSLPVIVIKGKQNKLVGMVSAWDVLEKIAIGMCGIGVDESTINQLSDNNQVD